MSHHGEMLRRFYGPSALLLHPDDHLLLDVLRSLAEHYSMDLSADVACPALDEEPEWPSLHLDTARHRQRVERAQGG